MSGFLKPEKDGVSIRVRVQPRASKNEIIGLHQGEELRVRLTSPPVDGAANEACRTFFAALLGIAKNRVTIVQGEKSRHKRLLIRAGDFDEILGKLAAWTQV